LTTTAGVNAAAFAVAYQNRDDAKWTELIPKLGLRITLRPAIEACLVAFDTGNLSAPEGLLLGGIHGLKEIRGAKNYGGPPVAPTHQPIKAEPSLSPPNTAEADASRTPLSTPSRAGHGGALVVPPATGAPRPLSSRRKSPVKAEPVVIDLCDDHEVVVARRSSSLLAAPRPASVSLGLAFDYEEEQRSQGVSETGSSRCCCFVTSLCTAGGLRGAL
jgi:hypothetical protein